MKKETRTYRQTETVFDNFLCNCKDIKDEPGYPKRYPEEGYTEDRRVNLIMNDGLDIEICYWHDGSIYVCDISVNKELFDKFHESTFMEYAASMGLYTENIEVYGERYLFNNLGEHYERYVLQYYLDE